MIICDSCKKVGEIELMVKCPKCGRIFHKNVRCVKSKEILLEKKSRCPVCDQEAQKINERFCPSCGEHLWNFHIDCGGTF